MAKARNPKELFKDRATKDIPGYIRAYSEDMQKIMTGGLKVLEDMENRKKALNLSKN